MATKFYKVPAAIEQETERAYLDENLGWLPKSKVEKTAERDHNGIYWLTVPAWLIRSKGISAYMMNNAMVFVQE